MHFFPQMLVCKTEEEWNKDDTEPPRKKDKDKKFVLNHGCKLSSFKPYFEKSV